MTPITERQIIKKILTNSSVGTNDMALVSEMISAVNHLFNIKKLTSD